MQNTVHVYVYLCYVTHCVVLVCARANKGTYVYAVIEDYHYFMHTHLYTWIFKYACISMDISCLMRIFAGVCMNACLDALHSDCWIDHSH